MPPLHRKGFHIKQIRDLEFLRKKYYNKKLRNYVKRHACFNISQKNKFICSFLGDVYDWKIIIPYLLFFILSFSSGCYLIRHWGDNEGSSSSSGNLNPVSSSTVASSSSSSITVIYTVTFDSQGATTAATPASITVTSSATTVVTLPALPAKTGYNFAGWYTSTNGGGTQFTASTPVTANLTVYAYWSTNPVYTVTYNSEGGSAVGSQYVTLPATTTGTLPKAPVKTGYYFGGWYTAPNGGGTAFTASTPVTGNITVYAWLTAFGSSWTVSSMPSSALWSSVIYGGGVFVAVAYDSLTTMYSH